MGSVYANACITIAAGNSPTVHSGILGPREIVRSCSLSWKLPHVEAGATQHKVYLREGGHLWRDVQEERSLDSRGWTYQEELFSHRRLVYTAGQTIWECMSRQETEAGGVKLEGDGFLRNNPHTAHQEFKALPTNISPFAVTDEALRDSFDLWYRVVLKYCQRSLSYEKDRLAAIGGMAKYFHDATGQIYCAGLWKGDLLRGLLWGYSGRWTNPNLTDVNPSWSWAAHGRDNFSKPPSLSDADLLASIVKCEPKPTFFGNNFGPVERAELIIKAPFCCLSSSTLVEPQSPSDEERITAFGRFLKITHGHEGSDLPSYRRQLWHPSRDIVALQIAKGFNLARYAFDSDSPKEDQHDIEILLLETVDANQVVDHEGLDDRSNLVCKRFGRVSLRKDFCGDFLGDYDKALYRTSKAAYKEVMENKWPERTVTVI